MGLLAIVLLAVVVFLWLFVRGVRAGHGKLFLAVMVPVAGIALLLSFASGLGAFHVIVVNLVALAVIGVPAWLLLSWLIFPRKARPPRDTRAVDDAVRDAARKWVDKQ